MCVDCSERAKTFRCKTAFSIYYSKNNKIEIAKIQSNGQDELGSIVDMVHELSFTEKGKQLLDKYSISYEQKDVV